MRRSDGTIPISSSASNNGSTNGAGRRTLFTPVQPRDDAAADADGVELVEGEVVSQTRSAGVHFGAAQRLIVGLLAGGHLHQRRAGQEDLRALLDHHHVVGHAGDVGAARGGVAEHQRDGRDARGRQPGQVPEHLPAGDEDLLLGGQVGAARIRPARSPAAGSASAIWLARRIFFSVHGLLVPPLTVGSLATSRHSTPSTAPMPATTLAPTVKSVPHAASGLSSRNGESGSSSSSMRSRGGQLAAVVVAFDVLLRRRPPALWRARRRARRVWPSSPRPPRRRRASERRAWSVSAVMTGIPASWRPAR